MQIINLNHTCNYWNNWRHFIIDLDHEFSSLIGYALYSNPDYYLMPSQSLSDADRKTYINSTDRYFYGYKLHYREGFINQESEDYYLMTEIDNEDSVILLPVGYGCVCQTQATNFEDNEYFSPRKFSIYPIGDGGFYMWQTVNNNWLAYYNSNDLGGFAASTYFNVSLTPLRYLVYIDNEEKPSEYECDKDLASHSILARESDNNTIKDATNNLWTGTEAIMLDLYFNDEELFDDFTYSIRITPNSKYEKVASLDIDTDEPSLSGFIQIW